MTTVEKFAASRPSISSTWIVVREVAGSVRIWTIDEQRCRRMIGVADGEDHGRERGIFGDRLRRDRRDRRRIVDRGDVHVERALEVVPGAIGDADGDRRRADLIRAPA
jgi:hypothetical protein